MGRTTGNLALSDWTDADRLALGRQIIRSESQSLDCVADSIGSTFLEAVEFILETSGCLIVSGMGKAGLIGTKIAATFASTGTPSHFLHPAEAIHGDLGRVRRDDLLLILSHSGETEEIRRILPTLRHQSRGLIGITSEPESTLATQCDVTIVLPKSREACTLGLAPSTSTTSMLALGDALALVVSQLRGFTPGDFAKYHPGGSLGKKLSRVEDVMRPASECRISSSTLTVRQVIVNVAKLDRRTGAIMLVDSENRLAGIFTDSDLARLIERRCEDQLDCPMESVMTKRFHAIRTGAMLEDAIYVLASRKFSELPVIDEFDRPLGMIDITDILPLLRGSNASSFPTTGSPRRPPSIRLFQAPEEQDIP